MIGSLRVKVQDFRVLWTKRSWSFLTTPAQKSLSQLLASINLYQHGKNQFIRSVHFWDTVNFRVPSPDWPNPFWPCPTPKILKQLLFARICTSMQKISLFYLFIFQIQSINESRDQISHSRFWLCPTMKFSINF